jgi:hypothetical protein
LPNPLIADDNFLLELPYAIGLCKGFQRLATFGNPAWAPGKPLCDKNLFWGCHFCIAAPVSDQVKET